MSCAPGQTKGQNKLDSRFAAVIGVVVVTTVRAAAAAQMPNCKKWNEKGRRKRLRSSDERHTDNRHVAVKRKSAQREKRKQNNKYRIQSEKWENEPKVNLAIRQIRSQKGKT